MIHFDDCKMVLTTSALLPILHNNHCSVINLREETMPRSWKIPVANLHEEAGKFLCIRFNSSAKRFWVSCASFLVSMFPALIFTSFF